MLDWQNYIGLVVVALLIAVYWKLGAAHRSWRNACDARVVRRRDKHATDQLRRLRRKVGNLQAELLRATAANEARRKLYWSTLNRSRADRVAIKNIEAGLDRGLDTSKALQEIAWLRDNMRFVVQAASSNRLGEARAYEAQLGRIARLVQHWLDYPFVPVDTSETDDEPTTGPAVAVKENPQEADSD